MKKLIKYSLVATLSTTLIACSGEGFNSNSVTGGVVTKAQSQLVNLSSDDESGPLVALNSNSDMNQISRLTDTAPKEEKCWFSKK